MQVECTAASVYVLLYLLRVCFLWQPFCISGSRFNFYSFITLTNNIYLANNAQNTWFCSPKLSRSQLTNKSVRYSI